MNRIIDGLNEHQRLAILEELLTDPKERESELIRNFARKMEQEDGLNDEEQARIGREVARRKNDPSYASGVVGKKLI